MAAAKPSVWLETTREGDSFANGSKRLHLTGRPAWLAPELIRLGETGLRKVDTPAIAVAKYVWQLRHEAGIIIETIMEDHGGPFAGRHARYVLKTPLRIIPSVEMTKQATAVTVPASIPMAANDELGRLSDDG
jgi:hypothetical protein